MRLHWKLMLTYLSIVVLVLASVHVYLNRAMYDFLVDQLEASLVRESRLVQGHLASKYTNESPDAIDALADEVGQRLGVRVTLIDQDGRVLGDSAVPLAELSRLDNHGDRPEVEAARRLGQGSSVRNSQTINDEMLYVASLVPGLGKGDLVLRLAIPLRDVGPMKKPVSRAIWMASVLGLALALALAYGSSRYVSQPIADMTRVAREVASGVYTHRLPQKGATSLELRELAAALDEMRRQIQMRIAQMTLEKSRLEAVLASITEGILVTEQNGRVSMVNRAFEKLFGSGDPAGRLPIELVRHRNVQEAIDRTRQTGQVVFLDLTMSDGLERYLDVHVAPILQDGLCIGTITVFYDITELRRLERIRKDFVANASHELRTPLTTIKGCAATLSEGALGDPEAARRFVEMINNHANRLHNLVEDILDLSRMESGKQTLDLAVCCVQQLVDSAIGQVKNRATEKEIDIEVHLDNTLHVRCDPKLIEQALLNLLDNAVKYTPEGGVICVQTRLFSYEENGRRRYRVSPESSEARRVGVAGSVAEDKEEARRIAIEVKDSGIGIPLASMSRVFERFYRVDQGRSRAMGGTGLGLSIVRHIMEAHGERVYVESEQGKGSTFGLTLPMVGAQQKVKDTAAPV